MPDELARAWERADELVYSKIRARLGFDRCESYVIGAAPAPLEVFEFFGAIGIPICEVWGTSELSCVGTMVPRDGVRFGTVGQPLPGVELRIADDGEVLVRGGIVMAGYRTSRTRRPRPSTPTAGCTAATSARSTTTATCGSSTARRS